MDIPSPIDLKDPVQARQWVLDTQVRRPYRLNFFRSLAGYLNERTAKPIRLLELGSGPGQLAAYLLAGVPGITHYTLLDFSEAMHDMARDSLRSFANLTQFVTADFRDETALDGLGTFDGVVTMQSVHELRHKRHVDDFYRRISRVLRPEGHFLVCDHIVRDPDAANAALFMTREEQWAALQNVGFEQIERLLDLEGMTLFVARKPA